MRRLRSLFLILVALWLPLQTAAAWAMPFARMASAHAAVASLPATQMTGMSHCHMSDAPAGTNQADAGKAKADCTDNCGICHLASAGYPLAVAAGVLPPLATDVLAPLQARVLASHIPEPPQHPPRRTS